MAARNAIVEAPNLAALEAAFKATLALIEQQKPCRQRALTISALENAFFHAVLSDAGIDSPIRMK